MIAQFHQMVFCSDNFLCTFSPPRYGVYANLKHCLICNDILNFEHKFALEVVVFYEHAFSAHCAICQQVMSTSDFEASC